MRRPVSDIAFTPTVKAVQVQHGSRDAYARMERERGWEQTITPELEAFIAERDALYLGTANADGQPYIQHRGGPKGFVVSANLLHGFGRFILSNERQLPCSVATPQQAMAAIEGNSRQRRAGKYLRSLCLVSNPVMPIR